MTVVAMSHGELSGFDTLMRVERGELRLEDAAAVLGLMGAALRQAEGYAQPPLHEPVT